NPLPGAVSYSSQGQGVNVVLYASSNTTITTSGSHTITAKYSGDANYGPSTSPPVSFVAKFLTLVAQSESSTNLSFGQSITVKVVITGNDKGPALAGQINFSASYTPINGPVTAVQGTDGSGNPTLTATAATSPQSTEALCVTYNGDPNYTDAAPPCDTIIVNIPDFSLAASQAPFSVTAGQSATTTITVTPASTIPSTVALGFPG